MEASRCEHLLGLAMHIKQEKRTNADRRSLFRKKMLKKGTVLSRMNDSLTPFNVFEFNKKNHFFKKMTFEYIVLKNLKKTGPIMLV